jgi:F-type H+-transporting ATPase subunit b
MQIDWITVSAQIINFLILVWLLKRFLYKPVIRAMERREQRINERLDDARTSRQQAEQQAAEYRSKREELERQREQRLAEAREQAEQEKKQLLAQAREEVKATREQWQRQVEREQAEFLEKLRVKAAESIQAIARKTLRDLADSTLEEQIVQVFVTRLESLDADARKALAKPGEPLRISSAFELDSRVRDRLTRAVHEHLGADLQVSYAVSAELLCGIRLDSEQQQLSWNLADYMDELTARIEEAFSPLRTSPAED